MKLSRRQFIADFCLSAKGQMKGLISFLEDDAGPPTAPSWFSVGKLSEFPPGTSKSINGGAQLMFSNERGLWASDVAPPQTRRPLKFGPLGQILINPNDAWPSDAVLSPLTGEMSPNREVERES